MKNADKPAHPTPYENQDGTIQHGVYNGLTKREYFAAMALQGLCANYLRENIQGWDVKTYVTESISLADELLKQLES
jgi:hypothetical protein